MKIFKAIAAGVLAVGLLAGCGTSTAETATKTGTGGQMRTYVVDLPDGGTVLCVVYSAASKGGISCNWEDAK